RADILNVQYLRTARCVNPICAPRSRPYPGPYPGGDGSPPDLDVGPAVDAENLPRDPRRVLGREEHRGPADVDELAGTAERDRLQHDIAGEAEKPPPHLRAYESGGDAVDAHAGVRALPGEPLHGGVPPAFGDVVRRAPRARHV